MPDTSPVELDLSARPDQARLGEALAEISSRFGTAAPKSPTPPGRRAEANPLFRNVREQRRWALDRRADMTDFLTWGPPQERVRYWWSELTKFITTHGADYPTADVNELRRELNTITAHLASALCAAEMAQTVLDLKDVDLGGRAVAIPFLQRAVRAAACKEVWAELQSGELGRYRDALMTNRHAQTTLVWNLRVDLFGPVTHVQTENAHPVPHARTDAVAPVEEEDWEALASGWVVARRKDFRSMKDVHDALKARGYKHSLQALYKMQRLCDTAAAAEIYKPRKGNVYYQRRRGHREKNGRVEAYAEGE